MQVDVVITNALESGVIDDANSRGYKARKGAPYSNRYWIALGGFPDYHCSTLARDRRRTHVSQDSCGTVRAALLGGTAAGATYHRFRGQWSLIRIGRCTRVHRLDVRLQPGSVH